MNSLAMFVPLAKADAAQRLVYGSIDETPDRAREIMDYASAKQAFQSWSDGMFKASAGKSYGNIRAQHDLKKAAGVLREITFDDTAKRINFCAHIVDDQEWQKVEAGVYTGFSPGGSYAKRWADPSVPNHQRYTPSVGELSIVDVPCIPSGTFTMVKADGAEAEVEFVLSKAYEPGNEATKVRAEEMAKAATGTTFKDHVGKARADLIAENATATLTKVADAALAAEAEGPDRAAQLEAALAKADKAISPKATEPSKIALVERGDAPLTVALFADLAKSAEAMALIEAKGEESHPLAKGMYSVGRFASLISSFCDLQSSVTFETEAEGDASTMPTDLANAISNMGTLLIRMTQEEVGEIVAAFRSTGQDISFDPAGGDVMALANQITDLAKADTDLMEKAGARNSKNDAERIQTIHDKSCEMGASCTEAVEKAAGLASENERLAKAVDSALPRFEQLTEALTDLQKARAADAEAMTKMQAEIVRIGDTPAAPNLGTRTGEKHEDTPFAKADEAAGEGSFNDRYAKANATQRRNMLLGRPAQ